MAALIAYAQLAGDQQALDMAMRLQKRIRKCFYVPEKQLYASRIVDGKPVDGFHEHTQALALLYDVADSDEQSFIVKAMLSDQCGISSSLSSLYISLCALEKVSADGVEIMEKLYRCYQPMLDKNTGTLWETAQGSYDFGYAGSLCHGWSALPVYAAKALLLGVKPLCAGWKKVQISPVCAALTSTSGEIPTPMGPIRVSWQSNGQEIESLKVEYPAAMELVLPENRGIFIEKNVC